MRRGETRRGGGTWISARGDPNDGRPRELGAGREAGWSDGTCGARGILLGVRTSGGVRAGSASGRDRIDRESRAENGAAARSGGPGPYQRGCGETA